MTSRSSWTLSAAVALVLLVPAAAQAAVKTVAMGPPHVLAAKPIGDKYSADVLAFFPSSIAVRVGDSVQFDPVGFHTTHFLGKKGKEVTQNVLGTKKVAGVLDARGVPFGFNGQPEILYNPIFFGPSKLGKTVVTDGTKEIESGVSFSEHAKPMTVKFTKPGLFKYVCDVHAGMKGSVRVVPRSKGVPSAAADAARVSTQIKKAIAVAKTFATTKAPANTVNVGLFGAGGVELFDFSPKKLSVPVGTTVTFTANTPEVHTASTGPGDPMKDAKSYLGTIATSFEKDDKPPQLGAYPSDGGAAPALTPLLHGNGFWNAGMLDNVPATPFLARSEKVTFAQAGTYEFYCLIHTFMHTTVTVQ